MPGDTTSLGADDALIVVDVQNDFLPGGALAVDEGDEVVPIINRYLELFAARQLPVVATRDWHPFNHCSFLAQGGPWPPHCVAGTDGAQFAPGLQLPPTAHIVSKATTTVHDAYSGFQGTELHPWLQARQVRRLMVAGLATDYCVRQTVLDALALGYQVVLLRDAIRAVELRAGDGERALIEMRDHGAATATLEMLA